jgi:cbb3-type cytochrome oxidase subunit 3
MIPSNFKDILANIENAGLYSTISMIIFILFFIATVLYVVTRPKKHYSDVENAPLEDDNNI